MSRRPLTSSLLVGRVEHVRRGATARRFGYRTATYVLALDELDALERRLGRLFGVDRRRVAALRTDTHLVNDTGADIEDRLAACLVRHGRPAATGTTLLVANMAVFGYVFNPVTWWLCHDSDERLHTVIVEVRNTFGESHTYAMEVEHAELRDRWVHAHHDKALHVSPFLPMQMTYGLDVRAPSPHEATGEHCSFVVRVLAPDGELRFLGMQEGRRVPLTRRSLLWTLLRYPLAPQLVLVRIHAQALRLWAHRVPFHRKPRFRQHVGSISEENR